MPAYMLHKKYITDSSSIIAKANNTINMASKLTVVTSVKDGIAVGVSFVKNCLLGNKRLYKENNTLAWFYGHLVDHNIIPWEDIISSLKRHDLSFFKSFKAPFAISLHDYETNFTYIVSDYYSQLPVFYTNLSNEILISTSYETFFECLDNKKVNEEWIYQFMMLNHPLHAITPIQDVWRMPPASVLYIDSNDNSARMYSYAEISTPSIPYISKQKMKEISYDIFKKRVPLYYNILNDDLYGTSITAGFDSRLILSLKPENAITQLYSYGIKDSEDVKDTIEIASMCNSRHNIFYFNEDILNKLSEFSEIVLNYSGTSLNILRAMLAYVYDELSNLGLQAIVTGINGDHFFRASGTVPHVMSQIIFYLLSNTSYTPEENAYFNVFSDQKKALEYFSNLKQYLEKQFSWSQLRIPERKLTFLHYETAPKHYGSEFSFADNYVALVSPYWDTDIRKLSFNSNLSTLTTCSDSGKPYPYWICNELFTDMISKNHRFKDIKIHGVKPKYYAAGNKYLYRLGQIVNDLPNKMAKRIFKNPEPPLERWDHWLNDHVLPRYIDLFKDPLIAQYITKDSIEKINDSYLVTQQYHLYGRILNIEMILRKF